MAKEELLDPEEFEALMGDALSIEQDTARAEAFRDQMLKKSWAELEVVERGERLLFPEKLWKRVKDGRFQVTPIMVQVPRLDEMRTARAMAHRIAAADGIDPKRDPIEFENIENVCIMSWAVRDATSPYSFMFAASKDLPDPRMLEKKFDEGSLAHLWARLKPYKDLLNPQLSKLTRADFMAVIAAVAERRDIAPLHAIDGPAQNSCIVTMACLLHSLMTRLSLSLSSETSMLEPSGSESSTSSSEETEPSEIPEPES
jgi:hypothetical protein